MRIPKIETWYSITKDWRRHETTKESECEKKHPQVKGKPALQANKDQAFKTKERQCKMLL